MGSEATKHPHTPTKLCFILLPLELFSGGQWAYYVADNYYPVTLPPHTSRGRSPSSASFGVLQWYIKWVQHNDGLDE